VNGNPAPQAGRGLYERGLALAVVVAMLATALAILAPFGTVLLWSLFMSVTVWPLHRWFLLRTGGHPPVAATLSVTVLLLLVVAPIALTALALVPSLRSIVDLVSRPETWNFPDPPAWIRRLPIVGRMFHGTWRDAVDGILVQVAGSHAETARVAEWGVMRVLATTWTIVQVLLAAILAWPMLAGGERGAAMASAIAERVGGRHGVRLVELAAVTIRYVSVGIIGTAAILALIEGIGLWFVGVPAIAVLMVVSFVMDVMQLGIHLVYLGAAGWLFYAGRPGAAVFTLVWGFVANNVIDSVARPYVISRGTGLPMSVIFLGAMGGLIAWGFIGVFVGPTLLGLTWTLLRVWLASPGGAEPEAEPGS
jgi:predicted PurR-regulated permease PerM